jgi:hypothetical protein
MEGAVRVHCRVCHVTFDDDVLLDAHPARRVLSASPPSWAGRRGRCVVSVAGRGADRRGSVVDLRVPMKII